MIRRNNNTKETILDIFGPFFQQSATFFALMRRVNQNTYEIAGFVTSMLCVTYVL